MNTNAIVTTESEVYALDGEALADHARSLGAQAGEATDTAIHLVMKAKEEWTGGTFKVLFGLMQDYGSDVLSSFAVPDSEDGNNPDEFKVYKEDGKGKRKLVKSSFYVQFADATPAGQGILSRIEWTERAGNPAMVKDDVPQDILEMTPREREVHLNYLKGRRTTIRAAYKKAMAVYFQQEAVNGYPDVVCEPIWVKGKSPASVVDGEMPEVENTTKPISLYIPGEDGRPASKWEAFSIGAFLKLDVKKAMERGSTWQSLIDSGATKKAPGSGATSNNGDALVIKTPDKWLAVLAEEHRYSNEVELDKTQAEYTRIVKLLNSKNNDEAVTALVEYSNFLKGLCEATGAYKKYTQLQQSGSDLVKQVNRQAAAA